MRKINHVPTYKNATISELLYVKEKTNTEAQKFQSTLHIT